MLFRWLYFDSTVPSTWSILFPGSYHTGLIQTAVFNGVSWHKAMCQIWMDYLLVCLHHVGIVDLCLALGNRRSPWWCFSAMCEQQLPQTKWVRKEMGGGSFGPIYEGSICYYLLLFACASLRSYCNLTWGTCFSLQCLPWYQWYHAEHLDTQTHQLLSAYLCRQRKLWTSGRNKPRKHPFKGGRTCVVSQSCELVSW